jgi:hypothetical protein
VPAEPAAYPSFPKFPPAVQEVPSYSSVEFVSPGTVDPPNFKPAVCKPAAAVCLTDVANDPPAVQAEPSYSSVDVLV